MSGNTKGKFYSDRDLLLLVGPLVVELALKLIVGLVDSIMVASVGEAAVSGVSLIDSLVQLLIYIFAALASGGAVAAGQFLGAGDKKQAKKAAGELFWLNGVLAVGIMILIMFTGRWILGHVFGEIKDDVGVHAWRYFAVIMVSIPAIGLYEAGTAIFRTMNDSRTTMKISLGMNVLNAVGNAALIYGAGMGTAGAAISTVVSRWFAVAVLLGLLLKPECELGLERSFRHRFEWKMSKRILELGIPNGVENGMFQLGKIAILGLVAVFGTSAITANAVTQTFASMEMIPGNAVQLAMIPVVSRCVGARDYEQARFYNKRLLFVSYVTIWAWSALMVIGLPVLLGYYHLSAGTESMARQMFLIHAAGASLVWPLAFDLPAALRAAGDVKFPMAASVVSMWVFRFCGAYVLAKVIGIGAVGVWIAMAFLDWGGRSAAYVWRWKSGKWMRVS